MCFIVGNLPNLDKFTKLFVGNTKFTLGRPKIANFDSGKTFKITNSQTLISANISSYTVSVYITRNN